MSCVAKAHFGFAACVARANRVIDDSRSAASDRSCGRRATTGSRARPATTRDGVRVGAPNPRSPVGNRRSKARRVRRHARRRAMASAGWSEHGCAISSAQRDSCVHAPRVRCRGSVLADRLHAGQCRSQSCAGTSGYHAARPRCRRAHRRFLLRVGQLFAADRAMRRAGRGRRRQCSAGQTGTSQRRA